MIHADLIKDRVSVPMLLERYGVKVGRGGRCACPIHHGKDANMAVKERWFRCYRCGKSGTVIDLQMALSGADFQQAIQELDAMFHLDLAPTKPSQRLNAKLAISDHQHKKRARAVRGEHNNTQYTLLCYLRRYCADRNVSTISLDRILDYYQGYDDDDLVPDAFKLAAHAGLQQEMEAMMLGAIDGQTACNDD